MTRLSSVAAARERQRPCCLGAKATRSCCSTVPRFQATSGSPRSSSISLAFCTWNRGGLLERVRATGAPPITRWLVDIGPLVFKGSPPADGKTTEAIAPRRTVLDKILIDGAADADVDVREGFTVTEILCEGRTVTGVRGKDRTGKSITENARIVIGAEGHQLDGGPGCEGSQVRPARIEDLHLLHLLERCESCGRFPARVLSPCCTAASTPGRPTTGSC